MSVHKVFLDTNVFNDLFTDGPAAEDVAFILEYIKRKMIFGCTSPKTLMDIYYLFHSEKGAKVASKRVKQIEEFFGAKRSGLSILRTAYYYILSEYHSDLDR